MFRYLEIWGALFIWVYLMTFALLHARWLYC